MKNTNIRMNKTPLFRNVQPEGTWGDILKDSCQNYLQKVSDDLLLDGFRAKPGIQAFIGEHIGKFLLASIPTSLMLDNKALEKKVKSLVERLIKEQERDGYLGTYEKGKRWMDNSSNLNELTWDLWVHKYCILALLVYYEETLDVKALNAAKRAGDVVAAEYGIGKKDINKSDSHGGLASGSILEAIMRLYRYAPEEKYLTFARYIVETAWEKEDGPRLMQRLRKREAVSLIAKGKAYEMTSCFVGLTEYSHAVGRGDIIKMLLDARDRMADTQRYPTGAMSRREHFMSPGILPEEALVETCVTFTWIQFNLRLFEIAGDERALDLAEEAAWNQLLPAISPDRSMWTYMLPITGPKRFPRKWVQGTSSKKYEGAPVTCCHTNGQRGLAIIPTYAVTLSADGTVFVNFYGTGKWTFENSKSENISITQKTNFPRDGKVELEVEALGTWVLALRKPGWCLKMTVDGVPVSEEKRRLIIKGKGKKTVCVEMRMAPRLLLTGFEARGKCALAVGPLIMAMENPPKGLGVDQVAVSLSGKNGLKGLKAGTTNGWPSLEIPIYSLPARAVSDVSQIKISPAGRIKLKPVLFAGLKGNRCLTEDLREEQIPVSTDEFRQTMLPIYRVQMPFFWSIKG